MKKSRSRRATRKMRRGGATPFPGAYYGLPGQPAALPGADLLPYRPATAGQPFELGRLPTAAGDAVTIRPRIGGFVPSVGEPFVAAAGKYIVPLALFAGYKLMNRKGKKTRRSGTKRRSQRSKRRA
jgi:hypothetical protein